MDNSNAPQIILVMNEIDAINFRKKGYEQPGCRVIACNSEFKNNLARRLEKSNLLVDRNVLIKDPYTLELSYYPLESANRNIHFEYFQRYATVLSFLGATRVYIEEANIINNTDSVGGSAGADVNGLGGKVSGNQTNNSRMQDSMKLDHSFKPNVDLPQAKKMIEDFSLQNDREINRIIKAVEAGTKCNHYEIELDLSQKMQSIFNLAASITPYAGINISAEIKTNKEITKRYKLHVRVEFSNSRTNG